MTTTTSPSKPTTSKTGSQSNPVDMTNSTSTFDAATTTTIGEKRKSISDAKADDKTDGTGIADEEEGGKDLVEKKQTTLDDIVHSEKDKSDSAGQNQKEKVEEKEDGRPAKKTKVEESTAEDKDVKKVEGGGEGKESDSKGEKEGKEGKVDTEIEMKSSSLSSPSKSKFNSGSDSKSETIKTNSSTSTTKIDTDDKKEANTDAETTTAVPSSEIPAEIINSAPTTVNGATAKENGNGNANGNGNEETVPGDEAHLDHPENWTTGADPATEKQKGFLKVLEKQKGVAVGDLGDIGKSEASEKIDELKNMCESEFLFQV